MSAPQQILAALGGTSPPPPPTTMATWDIPGSAATTALNQSTTTGNLTISNLSLGSGWNYPGSLGSVSTQIHGVGDGAGAGDTNLADCVSHVNLFKFTVTPSGGKTFHWGTINFDFYKQNAVNGTTVVTCRISGNSVASATPTFSVGNVADNISFDLSGQAGVTGATNVDISVAPRGAYESACMGRDVNNLGAGACTLSGSLT